MTINLRAGLVGLGMMGGNHARILSNLPGVDFVAAYDSAGNTSPAVKKEIIHNSLSSFKALNLDYCVIAVPTAVHEECALELISMGCHLLVEKPITHDSNSALNLQEALKNAGLRGAIGQIERYNPALANVAKGDAVVRTITLQAEGMPAELLPTLEFTDNEHFSVYPEKSETKNTLRQQEHVREQQRVAEEMAAEMERQAADLRKRADAMVAEAARLRDDDDLGGLVSSMRMMGR